MKTLYYTLCLAGAMALSATVTAQWSAAGTIYGGMAANDGAATFVIGAKGYLVGGSSYSKLMQYDTLTGQWTNKGNVPSGLGRMFASAFAIGGKGYVVGGDSSGTPVKHVWMYDTATSQWTKKKDFPGGVRDAAIAFAINDTGYAGFGFDGSSMYSDLWMYDPVNDSWTQINTSLPGGGLLFASCFVAGNKAYVIGGGTAPNGVNESNKLWEFDAATRQWTSKMPFPGAARQAGFAFANASYAFYGGGMAGYTTVYNDMWRYEIQNNNWTQVQNAPLLGPAWSSCFTIGNSGYAGIGAKFITNGLTGDDNFYRYNMPAPSVTSVDNIDHALTASVYPTVTTSILHIDGDLSRSATAAIYNMQGAKVSELINIENRTLDVSNLTAGMYWLRLVDGGKATSIRFIKN